MNRYTFLDLSINGIKIDINDISDNNFTKNSNNFNLDRCSDKKNTNFKVSPTKLPIYRHVYNNPLYPNNNYHRNYYSNNSERYLNKQIHSDITAFNMKVNKLLDDIRKKQEKERLDKEKDDKKEDISKIRYKGLIDSIDRDIENKDKKVQSSIIRYKEGANSKDDIDRLLKEFTKNYHRDYLSHSNFNGEISSKYSNDKPALLEQPGLAASNNELFSPKLSVPKPLVKRKFVEINETVECLGDLLSMIDKYPMKYDVEYNINMENLHAIKRPLSELDAMIGMNKLKTNIVDQILFFIQELHSVSDKNNQDFMHTVIYGPPGTGKTEIAKIMGNIFCNLGILKKNVFRKATRSDLIAGYLGQTAIKTRDLVTSCLGGVLFIDEAYALGNEEKRDSFAKECIDTLCEALSDHKDEIMVIIAGYEKELKNCFFNYNQGLESRFTWRFHTDDYKPEELMKIFEKKVHDAEWSFCEDNKNPVNKDWFEEKMKYFKYYGRDMETLFAKTKIAHSRRVFCKPKKDKTKINKEDLEKGFKLYLENDEVKNRGEDEQLTKIRSSMYM